MHTDTALERRPGTYALARNCSCFRHKGIGPDVSGDTDDTVCCANCETPGSGCATNVVCISRVASLQH